MILGIDVSHHQGVIDWNKVAQSGIQFAYVKATEGTKFVDAQFRINVLAASDHGIKVGAYHFIVPSRVFSPIAEVEHFLSAINDLGEHLTMPPVIDVESVYPVTKRMTRVQIAQYVLNFARELQRLGGRQPVIYTGAWYLDGYMARPNELAQYPLWLAAYRKTKPPVPAPWNNWVMWQYTSSMHVNGIAGNVDGDEANPQWFASITNPPVQEANDMTTIPDATIVRIVKLWYDLLVHRAPSEQSLNGWVNELRVNGTDGLFKLWAGLYDERVTHPLANDGTPIDVGQLAEAISSLLKVVPK